MPVYEYLCNGGHAYELTEGFDAPNQHKCQVCGKTARRQISVPAVIFKGSGFYSTDNRGGNRRNGGSPSTDASDSTPAGASSDGHSHGSGGHSRDSKPKIEASVD